MDTAPRRPWYQFSLRTMFVGMTVLAIIIGDLAQLERMRRDALKDAIRQAIMDGRIPPESARGELGDEVDQLAKSQKQ